MASNGSPCCGGAGGTLYAPLYHGGAMRAQVELRTAEQKEAVARYGSQVLRALGDEEGARRAAAQATADVPRGERSAEAPRSWLATPVPAEIQKKLADEYKVHES